MIPFSVTRGRGVFVASGGGGGGSYSDNDWPSLTNRPAFNSTTKVLTWVGPSGGGANDGNPVLQSRTLSSSGSITTSSNGQVISGVYIIGGEIVVNHNNVTIQQCYVEGTGADDTHQIFINSGKTGTIVEDCNLNGETVGTTQGGGNIGGAGASIDSATVRRNALHDHEQGVRYGLTNLSITDNIFYNPTGNDSDQVEMYGGSNNVTIQHNTFQGVGVGGWNSAVNLTNYLGTIGPNISLINNRFLECGSFFAICDDNGQGGGATSWNATNNGFYNCPDYRRDATTITSNTGNFNMATSDATSGTLVNGTGAI